MNDARDTWPLADPEPRIPSVVKRAPMRLNRQAIAAIAVLVAWAAIVAAVTVLSHGTAPSQFDYDNGAVPPTETDRHRNVVAGVAYVLTLPVSFGALWLAARSLRQSSEQVSSTIAVITAALASVGSIYFLAVGVGTFIFFT